MQAPSQQTTVEATVEATAQAGTEALAVPSVDAPPVANQFLLQAEIAERELLRYTPGGVPVVSATLRHVSRQMEAGVERAVEFEVPTIAAGQISGRFAQADLGASHLFKGFMARKNRNSKSLVFHIIDF